MQTLTFFIKLRFLKFYFFVKYHDLIVKMKIFKIVKYIFFVTFELMGLIKFLIKNNVFYFANLKFHRFTEKGKCILPHYIQQ